GCACPGTTKVISLVPLAMGALRLKRTTASAAASDGERLLRQELARGAEREQVRRLRRRQARLDARVEVAVVALEAALVPDLEHLLGEGAVVLAVHRGLVVLATRDEDHRRVELGDDARQPS